MLAVILATVSAMAWGAADFLGGLQSRRMQVLVVILCSQAIGTAALALVVLAIGGVFPSGGALAAMLGGAAAGIVALLAFYAALAVGTMSIVAPVAATGAALPVVFGLAAGERPGALQGVGFVLAVGGVMLAAREPPSGQARDARLALLLALLSAVGFGAYFIGIDEATKAADPLPSILAGRLCALGLIAAILVARPAPLPGEAGVWGALAAVGLLDASANALFAVAADQGLLSVVSVLGSLYPVMTVLLAHRVLGERLTGSQRAGVCAALGGVALIAAG